MMLFIASKFSDTTFTIYVNSLTSIYFFEEQSRIVRVPGWATGDMKKFLKRGIYFV